MSQNSTVVSGLLAIAFLATIGIVAFGQSERPAESRVEYAQLISVETYNALAREYLLRFEAREGAKDGPFRDVSKALGCENCDDATGVINALAARGWEVTAFSTSEYALFDAGSPYGRVRSIWMFKRPLK